MVYRWGLGIIFRSFNASLSRQKTTHWWNVKIPCEMRSMKLEWQRKCLIGMSNTNCFFILVIDFTKQPPDVQSTDWVYVSRLPVNQCFRCYAVRLFLPRKKFANVWTHVKFEVNISKTMAKSIEKIIRPYNEQRDELYRTRTCFCCFCFRNSSNQKSVSTW